jgi:hypothetical protein
MPRPTEAVPAAFEALASRRALVALGVGTALLGVLMLPAMRTMEAHGPSLIAFEAAGSVSRSSRILADWGAAGKTAAWWQLAIDTLFLLAYGSLLAGGCAAVARRAGAASRPRLRRAATMAVWFGPIAATADLAQNISLALILAGHEQQPWPRISAVADVVTLSLAGAAIVLIAVGSFATRA